MNPIRANGGRILIADDEASIRDGLVDVLTDEGYDVTGVADGGQAVGAIAQGSYDVVVTDLRMPAVDGLEVLRRVRELSPQTLVLLITAYASVETAVEALRNGAHDYILKPLILEDVLSKIHRLLEYRRLAWETQMLRREIASRYDLDQMVIRSPAMREIFALIQKVGPTVRRWWRAPCTPAARAASSSSCRSTVARSRRTCWRANFLVTPAAPSPAPCRPTKACSNVPAAAPYFSTRLAISPPRSRSNCCGRSRAGKSWRLAPTPR
jgi:CheY-like chemotaxis protein